MSSLHQYVDTLDIATRERIWNNLGHFERNFGKIGARIAPNLRRDRFLPAQAAKDFATFFLNFDSTEEASRILAKYQNICRRHALSGGEIRLQPYPPKIGRAVEAGKFKNKISAQSGISISQVSQLFDRLERDAMTGSDWAVLASCKMSQYGCWVTWDMESGGAESPFAFSGNLCALEIRAALGLERNLKELDLPLFVFEYSSSEVNALCRPTMADADAFLRFHPCDPPPPIEQDWFGLTSPWLDEILPAAGLLPRRPEAVHQAIAFPREIVCQTAFRRGDLQ